MKRIEIFRLLNRYVLASMLLLLASLLISWFYTSDLFYWYFIADFEKSADLIGQNPNEMIPIMVASILNWEIYISSAMTYTLYIMPIISILPVIQFFNEINGYLKWVTVRMKSYKSYLYSTIMKYSLLSGLCTSIPFLLFFTLGSLFLNGNLDDIGNYGKFLGDSFYSNHPFLFFLFLASTIYFAIGFTFGLMGCAITIWFEKKQLLITLPIVYYLVIGNIAEAFELPFLNIVNSVVAYNTLSSTVEVFIPLLTPILISMAAIVYHERRGGWFEL